MCFELTRLHAMKHILILPFARLPASAIVSTRFVGKGFHKASSI